MDRFIQFKEWDKVIKYKIYEYTMKRCKYVGCPFAFDIETTSFYDGDEKRACMYIWQVCIGEECIYGRTWDEFIELLDIVSDSLLGDDKRIICYCHNLAYEWHWLSHRLEWEHIFAREKHKVITALCDKGIEFRCSYVMSGYSLGKLAENYTPIRKLKGDLDYTLKRHQYTPLSDEELAYCYNDVKILYWWWKYIEQEYIFDGEIKKRSIKIPLTQTSVVRTYCRNALNDYCKNTDGVSFRYYRDMIKQCSPRSQKLYDALCNAYAGGYTHGNYLYIGRVLEDVTSYDFTSSYPSVMLNELYPMSPFVRERVSKKEHVEYCLNNFCCLIHVAFYDIKATKYNHIISVSKCLFKGAKTIEDNGRIEFSDYVEMWITEQDFKLFQMFYEWGECRIIELYTSIKGRLPRFLIGAMAHFYEGKKTLKGVAGKEMEYLHSKENLNSTYGMMVTSLINADVDFINDEWIEFPVDIEQSLIDASEKPSTFLLYQWGVWVTAYARYNLLSSVAEMDEDVVYCDTDSCKVLNIDAHNQFFADYNNVIESKNKDACEYYGLDFDTFRDIGKWDFDGHYDKFVTLGAKKYASDHHITVSGLDSKSAINYIENVLHSDIISEFKVGTVFPEGYSGRNVHTYKGLEDEFTCNLVDYNGVSAEVQEYTYIHMEETSYTLGLYSKFSEYLHLRGYRR